MFDGLLKSKFYSKCKSDFKMSRTRIDLIRKKRNAMQKYLRNDVADLLKRGMDMDAYSRAEGLLVEINRSSCYEFLDQCCEHISSHLSAMDKQRECPEECREAASSLMFAAARFADLPELREIRTLFSERYGNSLHSCVNKEFSEKLNSNVDSKDLKLQLLQEIAAELGLDWNSKALKNKLFNESSYDKNFAKVDNSDRKKDRYGPVNELKEVNTRNIDRKKDHKGPANELKEVNTRNEDRLPKKKETAEPKSVRRTSASKPQTFFDEKKAPVTGKNEDKPLSYKPNPPYTVDDSNPVPGNKPAPTGKNEDKPLSYKPNPPYTVDDSNPVPGNKPAPKSVRRTNASKPKTYFDEKKTNVEKAAQVQKILRFFDEDGGARQPDDDEKMMDKLLRHYSRKKGPSSDEKGKGVKHRTANRLTSLPNVDPEGVPEGSKKEHHKRSSSFQDGMRGGHVHPKLPDYDDFVSRLEVLRGNSRD